MEIEKRFCKECNIETDHVGVIVKSQNNPEEKSGEFISAFVAGFGAGSTAGFMELRDLHLVCNNCGHKIIEKFRGDLDN